MRPDIKLGIVTSMVVVFVAGSYFMYRAKEEKPVSLASATDQASQPAEKSQPKTASAKPATSARNTLKPKATGARTKKPTPTGARRAAQPQRRNNPPRATRSGNGAARKRSQPKTTPTKMAQRNPTPKKPVVTPKATTPASGQRVAQGAKKNSNPSVTGQGQAPVKKPTPSPVSLAATPSESVKARPKSAVRAEHVVETHRVQPGDSFALLAKRYYGSEQFTPFLIRSNPQITNPASLHPGQIIKIPAASQKATSSATREVERPTSTTARTYRVQPGDSFYKIAAKLLGDSSRWNELFELNRDLVKGDPKRLKVGAEIQLPAR